MIRSRHFDLRNGYEPGEPFYDVRQGSYLVDRDAERHGYGDMEWFGMTDADRLYGRACVWPGGYAVAGGEAQIIRKLEREHFDEVPPPHSEFVTSLWSAFFACGCESIRERMHRQVSELRDIDRHSEPRGLLIRTRLVSACPVHEAMRDARDEHRRRLQDAITAAFMLVIRGVMPLVIFEAIMDAFDAGPWVPDDPEDFRP